MQKRIINGIEYAVIEERNLPFDSGNGYLKLTTVIPTSQLNNLVHCEDILIKQPYICYPVNFAEVEFIKVDHEDRHPVIF